MLASLVEVLWPVYFHRTGAYCLLLVYIMASLQRESVSSHVARLLPGAVQPQLAGKSPVTCTCVMQPRPLLRSTDSADLRPRTPWMRRAPLFQPQRVLRPHQANAKTPLLQAQPLPRQPTSQAPCQARQRASSRPQDLLRMRQPWSKSGTARSVAPWRWRQKQWTTSPW